MKKISKKALAITLAALLILGYLPRGLFPAVAETAEHPGVVTLQVQDEEGNTIGGATVSFTITPPVTEEDPEQAAISGEEATGADGVVVLLEEGDYQEGMILEKATVSAEGYQEKTLEGREIISIADHIQVTLEAEVPEPEEITGFELKAAEGNLVYNEGSQLLFYLVFPEDFAKYTVEWTTNGTVSEDKTIVTATDANTEDSPYTASVKITREGYNDLFLPAEGAQLSKTINQAELDVTLNGESGHVFNDEEQILVDFDYSPKDTGDQIEWTVTFENETVKGTEIPTGTDAGEYTISLTIIPKDTVNYKTYYSDSVTVSIAKADTKLIFNNENFTPGFSSEAKVHWSDTTTHKFDFSAKPAEGTKLGGKDTITYRIDQVTIGTGEIISNPSTQYATINRTTGELVVNYPGKYVIVAEVIKPKNHQEGLKITHTLNVIPEAAAGESFISFDSNAVDYVLGTNNGVISSPEAETIDVFLGKVTYSWETENDVTKALALNENGKVSIANYGALIQAMESSESGEVTVTVVATMKDDEYFKDLTAKYEITISFADAPETPYTLEGTTGNPVEGAEEPAVWYTTAVIVVPADGFKIQSRKTILRAESSDVPDFENTLVMQNTPAEGMVTSFYLQDAEGGITSLQRTETIFIDTEAPSDVKVIYPKAITAQKLLHDITFGFYNPNVILTFQATDTVSGVDRFEVTYTREDENSTIAADWSETLIPEAGEDGVYTATLQIPLKDAIETEHRGTISVIAYDKAGNSNAESEVAGDNEEEIGGIIIDTQSPKIENLEFTAPVLKDDAHGIWFYDGPITVTATVNEANFNGDAVKITNNDSEEAISAAWKDGEEENYHIGEFTLTADGPYVIHLNYQDYAENVMDEVITGTMIIDTISPVGSLAFSDPSRSYNGVDYYTGSMTATIAITETNFYAEDVVVKVNGNRITAISWSLDGETHTGTFVLSQDGDYVISVEYTDRSGNRMISLTSNTKTIDNTVPVIAANYNNNTPVSTAVDVNGNTRSYYAATRTATVTITEHNFNADDVVITINAADVTGSTIASPATVSGWTSDGDKRTATIIYPGDANYTFTISYSDLATNVAAAYSPDYFTVDTTVPTISSISYNTAVQDSGAVAYYRDPVIVTIVAEDAISGVNILAYSIGSASTNGTIAYSNNGRTATISFEIPAQFDGSVSAVATDRSGNNQSQVETKRLIVDSIAPVAGVSYNQEVKTVDGTLYFDTAINGTITITETNFDSADVTATYQKDGAQQELSINWSTSGDTSVGTFTLPEDGDYVVSISYTDKSGNAMETYTSSPMTVDTVISDSAFTINGATKTGNGGAYNGNIAVTFRYADTNFDTATVTLTRANYADVEDVTGELIRVSDTADGGEGSFSIPEDTQHDGIYTLTVTYKDKAGHSNTSELTFIANRFGSVYSYDDYLVELIQDGGQFLKQTDSGYPVTKDLTIVEYNADAPVDGSVNILITRDGETIDAKYSVTVEQTPEGWYKSTYVISKENFTQDGVYKITVTSEDATANVSTSVPENSFDENGNMILDTMTFVVDTTAPEIRNVIGLESPVVNATELTVRYTIVDVGGLSRIQVYVDGELVQTVTEFADTNLYSGEFTLSESNTAQHVRLVATDIAGNITDTEADFDPAGAYVFNANVLVSTNAFVRFYANKGAFWGVIGGVVAVGAGTGAIIGTKKNKKKEDEE